MGNVVFGILTIIVSSAGFYLAFSQYRKANYRLALGLILCCGLCLRLFTAADLYLHPWDERFHALVAKNMMSNPFAPVLYSKALIPYDFRDWTANHIWLHKQPVALWLMAISMKIFGVSEIALRLPSVILSTLSAGLTWKAGNWFGGQKTGLLAAFFFSINGLLIELSGGRITTDHIDTTFLFFILLSVVLAINFAEKQKIILNFLAGLAFGLALLTKWLPALILVPLWAAIVLESGNFNLRSAVVQGFLFIFSASIVFIPWQVWIHYAFPLEAAYESGYNLVHLTQNVEGHSGPWYYYLNKIRINYGELVYLPLVWIFWKWYRDKSNLKIMTLIAWIGIPLFVFSVAQTKMQGYMVIAAPAIFIITSACWFSLYDIQNRRWLIRLVLFLLIALPVRYTIERVKPFEQRIRHPQWVKDLKQKGDEAEIDVLFNYPDPVSAMFYTDWIVYPDLPGEDVIQDIKQRGLKPGVAVTGDQNSGKTSEELTEIRLELKSE